MGAQQKHGFCPDKLYAQIQLGWRTVFVPLAEAANLEKLAGAQRWDTGYSTEDGGPYATPVESRDIEVNVVRGADLIVMIERGERRRARLDEAERTPVVQVNNAISNPDEVQF